MVCVDSTPLTKVQKTIVIIAHYATFVTTLLAFYATYAKLDILKKRIFSPFILLLSIVWLQVGPAFEIAQHAYLTDWELEDEPGYDGDIINGSFAFFNFGGNFLLALGMARADLSFFRRPDFSSSAWKGILDLISMTANIIFVIAIFLQPILYATLGKEESNEALIPLTCSIAGIFAFIRVWRNLGPNLGTLLGGLFFLVFVLLGVAFLNVYESVCIEFIHTFIGGSFVSSMVPLSVAIWYVEPPTPKENDEIEEEDNAIIMATTEKV